MILALSLALTLALALTRTRGEDERQVARWSGVCGEKGRWKQNLIAKCMRDGKAHDDASVSPVVRQTLLHWAYELTEVDFKQVPSARALLTISLLTILLLTTVSLLTVSLLTISLCTISGLLTGRQARQDARRDLRAAGAAERHRARRRQEARARRRRRRGCRRAEGQGGGRGGGTRKAREEPRGLVPPAGPHRNTPLGVLGAPLRLPHPFTWCQLRENREHL